jgi:hypothetical protein
MQYQHLGTGGLSCLGSDLDGALGTQLPIDCHQDPAEGGRDGARERSNQDRPVSSMNDVTRHAAEKSGAQPTAAASADGDQAVPQQAGAVNDLEPTSSTSV